MSNLAQKMFDAYAETRYRIGDGNPGPYHSLTTSKMQAWERAADVAVEEVGAQLRDKIKDLEERLMRTQGERDLYQRGVTLTPEPIAMHLICPQCYEYHIDEGELATKPHHTHACQHCGLVWRPALVATVGVKFLPGFKNEAK